MGTPAPQEDHQSSPVEEGRMVESLAQGQKLQVEDHSLCRTGQEGSSRRTEEDNREVRSGYHGACRQAGGLGGTRSKGIIQHQHQVNCGIARESMQRDALVSIRRKATENIDMVLRFPNRSVNLHPKYFIIETGGWEHCKGRDIPGWQGRSAYWAAVSVEVVRLRQS